MKKYILLLALVTSVILIGCSTSGPVNNQQESVEKLEKRIAELEWENSELKARLKDSEESDSEETDRYVPEKGKIENVNNLQIGDTIKTNNKEITINNIEFSYDVLPDDTTSFYTHYPAESGNVYIHIDVDVKNLQKQNLNADEIMSVEADFNNGYTYGGSAIPEDSTTGFTYANITSIKPLESLGVRFLIESPQEVEESDESLILTFTVDGDNFVYSMR